MEIQTNLLQLSILMAKKDRYFVKRFLVENENKEEIFISETLKSLNLK